MLRSILITSATAVLIAAPALASTPVSSVDVSVDITAIENPQAAQFWSDLEGDLEEAILIRVADRLDTSGSRIRIDIDEISLASSFQGALGVDSVLMGDVNITNPRDKTKTSFYDLRIKATQQGGLYGQDVQLASVSTDKFYETLIDGFANAVVRDLR